jgi:hypothetical protein
VALAAGLGLALTACSSLRTTSDYDPKADFGRLRTYAWLPHSTERADPRIDTELLRVRVQRSVDAELDRKGLTPAPSGAKPDLLVDYHVTTKEKVDVVTFPSGWGYGPGWSYGPATQAQSREYTEGTLILDFIDASTRQLLWRGTASAEIVPGRTPEQREQRIDQAVREILAPFPPHAAGS